MSGVIREASPDDAPFLAWVMQEAGRSHLPRGVWDLAMPDSEDERLDMLATLATTKIVHFGHWTRFLISEVDGEPAAALSAYDPALHGGQHIGLGFGEAFRRMAWSDERIAEFGRNQAPFGSLGFPTPDGFWVVEWVATRVPFRGRGLVQALLLEVLERGREAAYGRAQIGYFLGNTPAQRAYEKAGFKWIDEYRHPDWEAAMGTPGVARMHLDL